jgi:hypothetical protein
MDYFIKSAINAGYSIAGRCRGPYWVEDIHAKPVAQNLDSAQECRDVIERLEELDGREKRLRAREQLLVVAREIRTRKSKQPKRGKRVKQEKQ